MPKINKVYVWKRVPGLPSEYQEVEYIQSSNGQYINTGLTGNGIGELEIKFNTLASAATSYEMYFGGNSAQYSTCPKVLYVSSTVALQYKKSNTTNTQVTLASGLQNVDRVLKLTYAGVELDGTKLADYTPGAWGSGTLWLFNNSGESRYYSSMKLYYFKAWTDGVLVRHFVPCYRKSDNVIGLYDIVNDQFYTNSGSGNFTKGGDVTGESNNTVYKEFLVRPKEKYDVYYSDKNREEYQSLVDSIGSVQFVDTGKRFRFGDGCYIGNRIALTSDGSTLRKVNLDTLTVIDSKSFNGTQLWYFGENRVLTNRGILDFDGNFVTQFSRTDFSWMTPGLPGIVRTNVGADIYKGIVDGDNIEFTKVGSGTSLSSGSRGLAYGRQGLYFLYSGENSSGTTYYINPETNAFTNLGISGKNAYGGNFGYSGPDGKLYKFTGRGDGWGRFWKIGTASEGLVGESLSTTRGIGYGGRSGKFLGNIVSGNMNANNGTGNGIGSNNYFVSTGGTLTKVQSNAFAYDTNVHSRVGFIDENGRIYPATSGGGTGVILKTNKTFTDLNWRNPFLWR